MEAAAADNILRFGPGAPSVLHILATVLLFLHIAGASVGMIAGAVALIGRKGRRIHRVAGNVFFVAMLVMAGVAAGVSPFLPEIVPTNIVAAVFTLYLVVTSWATVRRPQASVGRFETGAFVFALLMVGSGVVFGRITGDPTLYAFAVVASLAAVADFTVLRRGGVSGVPRIARHLWRMCAALFVATGSFFFGQADEIPVALQGPHITVLALAPLGLMVFWLIRIRFTRRRKASPAVPMGAGAEG
jgi:uncharacterized membrane protein